MNHYILRLFLIFLFISCTKQDIAEMDIAPVDDSLSLPLPALSFNAQQTLNWLHSGQLENGLIESAEHSDFVSLYDNALTALAFIASNDLKNAEKIFDFFNSRLATEFKTGTGGFYQYRNRKGENGGRTWMGDNAWLLIALNNYHSIAGNQKYQELANTITQWLRSLQDTDGGLWGGYNEDGSPIHKITEGIITAYNAVEGYDSFHEGILQYLKHQRWDNTSKLLVAWPENTTYYYAMDLHALGYLIFQDFPVTVLQKANRYLTTQTATSNGQKITGYCLDIDRDVVWLEGSAQMALAFGEAGLDFRTTEILQEIEKVFITSTRYKNAHGLPYTSNFGTSYGSSLLWEEVDTRAAVSSTVWYLFSKLQFNPFAIAHTKQLPLSAKFWVQQANN